MSTTIDYRREAFYFDRPYTNTSYVEREVLVLTEIGSSNCYDMNNRRTRSWEVFAFGAAYGVYGEVARHAASASGGMLVLARMGRWDRDYARDVVKVIRAYDKAIKAARPLEMLYERFMIAASLRVTGELDRYEADRLSEFLKKYGLAIEERNRDGAKIKSAELCLSTVEQLSDVHQFKGCKNTDVVYNVTYKGA